MTQLLFIFLLSFADLNSQCISEQIVKINVPPVTVHAGKSSAIVLNVEVKEGYHIQANKINDEFLIPATVEIAATKKIEQGGQLFPEAKKFKLEGTDDFL